MLIFECKCRMINVGVQVWGSKQKGLTTHPHCCYRIPEVNLKRRGARNYRCSEAAALC